MLFCRKTCFSTVSSRPERGRPQMGITTFIPLYWNPRDLSIWKRPALFPCAPMPSCQNPTDFLPFPGQILQLFPILKRILYSKRQFLPADLHRLTLRREVPAMKKHRLIPPFPIPPPFLHRLRPPDAAAYLHRFRPLCLRPGTGGKRAGTPLHRRHGPCRGAGGLPGASAPGRYALRRKPKLHHQPGRLFRFGRDPCPSPRFPVNLSRPVLHSKPTAGRPHL